MIYWAPFLHFYQPPTQSHAILRKVCDESYRPLLKMLLKYPHARLTINICGVLTEMLNNHGAADVIENIKKLARANQLEFVDSAKYHTILPLIPKEEMRRQIELNHKTNYYFFKDVYKTEGFFPPEMCYSDELATLLSEMAFRWVLVSGVGSGKKVEWPQGAIHKIPLGLNGINTFYRDDILSNKISFRNIDSASFVAELAKLQKSGKDAYVITAMDAETFGHHLPKWEELFLAQVYEMLRARRVFKPLKDKPQIKIVTISGLLDKFPVEDSVPPKPSSWSTTAEDLAKENYYPLWKGLNNDIHALQWEHIHLCFDLVGEAFRLKDSEQSNRFYDICRGLLDRAIYSCQFWWANKERAMWDINLINKGLMLQEEVILNAYKAINISGADEEVKNTEYYKVVAARDIANKIRDLLFIA